MANLLYRSSSTPTVPSSTTVKNAPLTNLEIDGNFKSVDNDLANRPTLTGTGATGTWSISISGSAATLTNARTIGGVSFNGSANINLPGVNTAGNQNTSGNAATATVSTNIASGSAGSIPYQTAANTTAMVAAGTSGQLFLSTGTTAPTWSTGLTYDTDTSTLSTTNFNSLSDINYKKNINSIKDATSTINQLSGVEFEWKDTGKKSSGVIAQELEKVLPHLVETNDNGIKTVNYAGLTAYLIEAIKELSSKIQNV